MQQLVLAVYERFLNPRQKYYWNGAAANNNGGGGGGGGIGIGLAAVNLSGGSLNPNSNGHGNGSGGAGNGGAGGGVVAIGGGRRFNRRIAAAAAAQQHYRDNVEHQKIAADARDAQSIFGSHRRKPNNSFSYRRDYCRHPQHRRYHHSYDDYDDVDNDGIGDGFSAGIGGDSGVYRSNPLFGVSTAIGGEGGIGGSIGAQEMREREAELLLKQIRARKRSRMSAGKQCSF